MAGRGRYESAQLAVEINQSRLVEATRVPRGLRKVSENSRSNEIEAEGCARVATKGVGQVRQRPEVSRDEMESGPRMTSLDVTAAKLGLDFASFYSLFASLVSFICMSCWIRLPNYKVYGKSIPHNVACVEINAACFSMVTWAPPASQKVACLATTPRFFKRRN